MSRCTHTLVVGAGGAWWAFTPASHARACDAAVVRIVHGSKPAESRWVRSHQQAESLCLGQQQV